MRYSVLWLKWDHWTTILVIIKACTVTAFEPLASLSKSDPREDSRSHEFGAHTLYPAVYDGKPKVKVESLFGCPDGSEK